MRVVFSERADKANIRVGLRGRGVGGVGERVAGVGGGGAGLVGRGGGGGRGHCRSLSVYTLDLIGFKKIRIAYWCYSLGGWDEEMVFV